MSTLPLSLFGSFFTRPATTEPYTLSLHDALPILVQKHRVRADAGVAADHDALAVADPQPGPDDGAGADLHARSEEHTSELQSPCNLVCRLLLEKKKTRILALRQLWNRTRFTSDRR